MNPPPLFCPLLSCPSRGHIGAGNLRIHDTQRNRWKCRVGKKTFSGRKGTPFYNLKHDPQLLVWVVTLLALGCPTQAIVATFERDERTVADWQAKAGAHCQVVDEAIVQTPPELPHVQADDIRVRCQRRLVLWLAMAVCGRTRLWLGAVTSRHRDKHLARRIAAKVRACAKQGARLLVTDGWPAYKQAFVHAFRFRVAPRHLGRPSLCVWSPFVLAQTVKWQEAGHCLGIRVCHLAGNVSQIACLLPAGQELATSYIERLTGTFGQRLCGLCRRSRCLLRCESTLVHGVYLVGTVYNFCTPHQSLRQDKQERTPTMAAGLAGPIGRMSELLCYQVAPPPFVAPKRRGRPPSKRPETTAK